MPLFWKFVNVAIGTNVDLNEIDMLIRKDFGHDPCDTNYCDEYMLICNIGEIVWSTNEWNQDKFEKLMGTLDENDKRIFKKYLNGDYKYECWVER